MCLHAHRNTVHQVKTTVRFLPQFGESQISYLESGSIHRVQFTYIHRSHFQSHFGDNILLRGNICEEYTWRKDALTGI